jgi:hypothetical protein
VSVCLHFYIQLKQNNQSGSNEVTLQYPDGLIENDRFRICVKSLNFDKSSCDSGFNGEEKRTEHVFINLFSDNYQKFAKYSRTRR